MLSSLGWIYGKIADARNTLYDRGAFETFDLGARTISVGNVTAGGTGKTPLVQYVARVLAERGKRVCILTRGYGRRDAKKRVLASDGIALMADPSEAGDEPVELARNLLGKAIVIADADRVSAAEWAMRRFGVTAFVLDDGFQHRKAKRDVDIVCIDATDPFGGSKMLPSGRLREPLHNLSRADIIVITRSNLVNDLENLKSEISDLAPGVKIFTAKNKITQVRPLDEFLEGGSTLADHSGFTGIGTLESPATAFCGIGNPASFYAHLRQENFVLAGTLDFSDHQVYNQQHIAFIEESARRHTSVLLTTAKDAVKLSNLKFEIPCYVVEIDMELDDDALFRACCGDNT